MANTPFFRKKLGVLVAVLLVLNAAAWYQLAVRAHRPPSFDRGGRFAIAGAPAAAESTTTAPSSTSTSVEAAPTLPTSTTIPAPANGYAPSSVTATSSGVPATPGVLPALGTYRWRVAGHESATGFGSRNLPSAATIVAHADGHNVVLDTTYSSDHQERLIVSDIGGSLGAVYEAGQVRFGPMAQSNSGSYSPAMTYVPADLHGGAVVKGTSNVTDANGKVERVEDWTLTVERQTTIPVLGTPTTVWQIVFERQTRPGGGQQVHRVRREWWDANRHAVVRYTDTMHGEQSYGGVTFTYDSDITADLAGFSAS